MSSSDGFILKQNVCRDEMVTRIVRFLELLPQDKPWEVLVRPFRKTRSSLQNRALWGIAYKLLSEHTGHEPEELHEYFLGEFHGWEVVDFFGQKKRRPKGRSHDMKTTEFSDFYAFIQRRAAETVGIFIPDPDPDYHWKKELRERAA
jgi:hypothetical protein